MRVVALDPAARARAEALLGRAFVRDPLFVAAYDGAPTLEGAAYLMGLSVRYALRYGEAWAAVAERGGAEVGVALVLPAGASHMTPLRMARAGLLFAPLHTRPRVLTKFLRAAQVIERAHRENAPFLHDYLLGIGVDPASKGRGAGRLLLERVRARAERRGVPVYLETQNPDNPAYYERYGYRLLSEHDTGVGPRTFAMLAG